MKSRSKTIIILIIIVVTLLVAYYCYLFLIKEYYIEGIVLDEETQQPVSGVEVILRGSVDAPGLLYGFSWGGLSWPYSYTVITDENGYFYKKLDNGNPLGHPDSISVEISFIKTNISYSYEHVREYFYVNQNVTIELSKKGDTPEYAGSLNTMIECENNGFYWDKYDQECLLEYQKYEILTSCSVDSDCKKICPSGCFNYFQEDTPKLHASYAGTDSCLHREYVCICSEGTCRSIEYPPGYFD